MKQKIPSTLNYFGLQTIKKIGIQYVHESQGIILHGKEIFMSCYTIWTMTPLNFEQNKKGEAL